MKIAAVTENGSTVSQHFGRAPLYVVLTVQDGKIVTKQTRNKAGHQMFAGQHHESEHCGKHGCGAGDQLKHAAMAESIADCEVLIAGGMGWGAYESLASQNIKPVVTDVENIDEAVELYLDGRLPNLMQRLH